MAITFAQTFITAAWIALATCQVANAQRVSELRDPQVEVFRAFPDADRYRTIPRDIDDDARREIEKRLPFKVHFDELGRHRLYVALRGIRPIGLLYMRTETSSWGLMEVAWSMTLDIRINKFRFQRCRNTMAPALQRSALNKLLANRSFPGLLTLLDEHKNLLPNAAVPRGAESLATTVVHSGMKAQVVTEVVWGNEIDKLADLQMGIDAYPFGKSYKRFTHRTSLAELQQAPPATAPPNSKTPAPTLQLHAVRAVQVRNHTGELLGTAVRTDGILGDSKMSLCWKFNRKGKVVNVQPHSSWPSAAMRIECRKLLQGSTEDSPSDDSQIFDYARQVISILRGFGDKTK